MKKSIETFLLFLCFITASMGVALATPIVESVAISGDKLIVTGHQFIDIDGLVLSDPQTGFRKPFNVESATESEIVGTAVDNQKITVASLMNLIIDTAKGETIYPVSFSLQNDAVTNSTIKDGAITPEKFIGITTPPADQSVLTWNEPTQSFIFTSPSGGGGSSGVSEIILGAGILGAPKTASGSVPLSVDIGATGHATITKIPYFNSKNKIVLDSTSSPAGSLTGLQFKDGTQNFYIFNDNGLRISGSAPDLLVMGVDGNLSLKGPVTIGGYDVCLSSGNCPGGSGGATTVVTATLPLVASGTTNVNISAGAVNTANNLVKLDSAGKFPSTIPGVVRGPGTVTSGTLAIYSNTTGENLGNSNIGLQNLVTMSATPTTANKVVISTGANKVLGTTAYTIPNTSGVTGQVLAITATNTAGWINPTGTGGTTSEVTSFNNRMGAVVPVAGDYTATLVTSTAGGSVSATTVQAAITELDSEKLPKSGGTMTGTITTSTQNALKIGAAGSVTGEIQFLEPTAAGTNYVGFKSPASLAANSVWTLPAADGTSGQVLSTNGSKVLSWTSAGAGGGISAVQDPATATDTTGTSIAIFSGEGLTTLTNSLWKLNGIQLEGPTAFVGENSTFKNMGVGCFSNRNFTSSASYGFCQDSAGDASLGTTSKMDFNVGGATKFSVGSAITTHQNHFVNTGNLVVDSNTFFVNSATNVVGIGTTGPVQVLEINSTTKGFLPPRMTTAQKDAISPQSTGLVVFDTDLNSLNVRNSTGWTSLGSGGGAGTGNVAGPASSKATNLATFADATGKLIQDSSISSSDLVTMSGAGAPMAGNVVVTTGGKLVADSTINLSNIPTMPANATLANQPILGVAGQKVQVAAPYTLPNKNCSAGQILKWDAAAVGFTCQADLGGLSVVQDPATATNTTGSSIAIFSGEGLATLTNSFWKLNGIQLEGPTAFVGENSTFKNMGVGCFSHRDLTSSASYGLCQDSTGDASLGTTNKMDFNVGGTTKFSVGSAITTSQNHFVNTGNLVVDTNTFFVNSATNVVGIGTTGPVQVLEINSTTKGFLPPRMTTTQKNAISPQSTGLVVFDTDLNSLNVRNSTGWTALGSGGAGAGDVAGPASAKATNLATYSDATGKVIADSGISSSDLVTMSGTGSVIAGNVIVSTGGKLVADSTINLTNIPTMPANATLANAPILGVAGQKVQVAAPYTLPSKACTAGQILKWDDTAVGFTCQSGGGLASVPGETSPLPLATLDTTIPIYSGEDGQTIKHSYWKLNGIQLEGPTAFIGENSVFKGLNVGCFSNKLFNSSNSYGFCQDTVGDASLGTTNKVDFNVGGNTKLGIGATITTHNNHLVNNGNLVVDTNTFFVNSATNNVGIGTTNPIQAFQVDSTTKGFLPPRMTSTQKNLINPQTPGMLVFDTTMNSLSLRTTEKWVLLGSASFATFGAPFSSLSDFKLKKNIKSLDLDVFEVLEKLNPVSFEWKNQLKGLKGDGPQFGFVAQEVEKVLPNLVITNGDGNKGVNEIAMIPLLMEAIKKQQKQIAQLQGKGPLDGLMINNTTTNSLPGNGKPVGAAPTVREPAGTAYTLAASDCGNNVALKNKSAITVSVPALTPGCEIDIVQTGAGQVTVTGAGITVGNIFGLYKTRGQYSIVTVKSINSKLAVLVGDVN